METATAMTDPPERPLPDSPVGPVKISIRSLGLSFDKHQVLSGVTMEIPAFAVTAVIGPSGTGKSSLLKCLNRGIDRITGSQLEGQILLDGEDIYSSKFVPWDIPGRVGMTFQQPNPFPKSVYENVAFGPKLQGVRKKSVLDDIVQQALEQANLWKEVKDILSRSGLSLSGGQQQRLCIARTLATKPEVILMDCPCSAIDPTSSQRIEDLIAELKRQYTIIIVTHNIEQARRVSDWVAFFLQEDVGQPGKLIEFVSSRRLFVGPGPTDSRTDRYIRGQF
jgi:phosphate transport system ATP-binding protein